MLSRLNVISAFMSIVVVCFALLFEISDSIENSYKPDSGPAYEANAAKICDAFRETDAILKKIEICR